MSRPEGHPNTKYPLYWKGDPDLFMDRYGHSLLNAHPPLGPAMKALEDELIDNVGDDVVTGKLTLPEGLTLYGYTLPLSPDDAQSLWYQGEQAMLGGEGQGTVMDIEKRSTKEFEATDDVLGNDFWKALPGFEEMKKKIHQVLCPTALHAAIVPYKLLVYEPGDFFSVHVDAMHSKHQFGSLAIEIPVMDDVKDIALNRPKGPGEPPKPHQPAIFSQRPADATCADPDGGDLLFHISHYVDQEWMTGGRGSAPVDGKENDFRINVAGCYDYEAPDRDSESMSIRVSLRQKAPRQRNGTQEVSYAAWLGDVPHEVQPVKRGYRIVLVYNLLKKGVQPLRIPRRSQIEQTLGHLRTTILQMNADAVPTTERWLQCIADSGFASKDAVPLTDFSKMRNIGILLRHKYPPGGLDPSILKGVDAVIYEVASFYHQCFLFPAYEIKHDMHSAAFRRRWTAHQSEQMITKVVNIAGQFKPSEDGRGTLDTTQDSIYRFEEVFKQCPPFVGTIWLEIGFGSLVGWGGDYGNYDCGRDWWYRQTALIITPDVNHWQRRKWLFLICMKGPETLKRLMSVHDVFEHTVQFV